MSLSSVFSSQWSFLALGAVMEILQAFEIWKAHALYAANSDTDSRYVYAASWINAIFILALTIMGWYMARSQEL